MNIKNYYGQEIDFDVAVELMDDEIREATANEGWYTEQEFFNAYCLNHLARFGEEFELNKPNPCY